MCRSLRTLNSKIVAAAAPAECSAAAQEVGARENYTLSFKDVGLIVVMCQRPHMELRLHCTIAQKEVVVQEELG